MGLLHLSWVGGVSLVDALVVQECCQIGDSGACGLGEGLKSNGSLRELWLVSSLEFLLFLVFNVCL